MFQDNPNKRHKNLAEVSVTLSGDEPFNATVFLTIGDRLIDLLNDDRMFIPMRREDGETLIVAKTQIASIVERGGNAEEPKEEPEPVTERPQSKKFDPYAMLRVSEDANPEERRAAYKARIKAVHPDSIAALGLDEDLAKAALLATQKVNYAYRKIMAEREDEAAQDEEELKSA